MGVERQKDLRPILIFAPAIAAVYIPIYMGIYFGDFSMSFLTFIVTAIFSYLTFLIFSVPLYIFSWKLGGITLWRSIVVGLFSALGITWLMARTAEVPFPNWWNFDWETYFHLSAPCGVIGGFTFWLLGVWEWPKKT